MGEVVVFNIGTLLLTAADKNQRMSVITYKKKNHNHTYRSKNIKKETTDSKLTCHDVIQRVCERLCGRGHHEAIRCLCEETRPESRQLLAQHYPLQVWAAAAWVLCAAEVCGLLCSHRLNGDEAGL